MAKKGDHDGASGRSTQAGDKKAHEKDATNSRTSTKQNAGHGGHK